MRRAIRYAIDLFTSFERETGYDPGFRQVGSLLLALTPERMASFQEHAGYANRNGVEAHFVDETEMSRLAPHLDVGRVEGGYFVPKDGYLAPGNARGPSAPPLGTLARGSGLASPRPGFRCGTAGWWGWRPTAVSSRRSRSW